MLDWGGVLFSPLFYSGKTKAFVVCKNYKLVTHISIENFPKGKTTLGNQNGPWDVYKGEAVLVWLNEVFCKEETCLILIDNSCSCKRSHNSILLY